MIVRTDIANHLEYGVRSQFLSGRNSWPSARGLISTEQPSGGKKETYVGLGAAPFPRLAEDQVVVLGLNERSIEIENLGWYTTVGVTHDAINDDRVGELLDWMLSAGGRFEQHKDERVFAALDGGDGTTYGQCYDGLEFFDTLHFDKSAEYQTVQSNLGTLALTLTNFNTIWVAAMAFKDNRGKFEKIPFNLLTVPPALKVLAANICNNNQAYDTANNEINPFSTDFAFHVDPNMGSTAWVISSTLLPTRPIIIQTRSDPVLSMWDDESQAYEGGVRFFKWYGRYNVGYGDWRQAYMGKT